MSSRSLESVSPEQGTVSSAMRRVAIVGCSGAGKSTLARQLGEIAGLPVLHLDALLWRPGWVMTPREEEDALIRECALRDRWIIDGNYAATLPVRLERADTVIFLDFPRRLCLTRVFKRVWHYRGRTRPDMAPDCPEKIDAEFLRWIWNYRRNVRPKVLKIIAAHAAGRNVHIFTRPSDLRRFLEALKATTS